MEVNDMLVEKIAHLARLEFNVVEKEEIKKDLQKMISFVEKLNELDTSDVEPLLHMTDEINVYREDNVEGSVSQEDALRNAPARKEGFFTVSKVIRK
jgi:aspartyl-tRNA(Asn)/glutamyl-tRNA(Gln) amidotransferase subunit C